MAKIIVEQNGCFNCDGKCCCGGSDFVNKESVIRCFNCEYCDSYKRDGLKIINNKGQQKLIV